MYFQNLFDFDFQANLCIHDKINSITYTCPKNAGRSDTTVITWNHAPYNLSGNDADGNSCNILNIYFSTASLNFKTWHNIAVDITVGAGSTSAVTAAEIIAALEANATFAAHFTAFPLVENRSVQYTRLQIKARKEATQFRFYIGNGRAEEKLKFNARAGVADLPSFFARHTIENANTFVDSQGSLIFLDAGVSSVDDAIIASATDAKGKLLNLSSTPLADWQLLGGKSTSYMFVKQTVTTDNQVTERIEYPAGAVEGDLARKIVQTFTGTQLEPDTRCEFPYVLQSSDLVTP